MHETPAPEGLAVPADCLECGRVLAPGEERKTTDEGVFCRPCYETLKRQVETVLALQGQGINWINAVVGAVLGGLVGVLIWWGFTVVTRISFGLVAVVIGIAVGKGILIFTNHKRSTGLQALAVIVSVAAYGYASYLVNRTFLLRAIAGDPKYAGATLPLIGPLDMMFEVIRLGFGIMDLVFLAIVVYQAWRMTAPVKLA